MIASAPVRGARFIIVSPCPPVPSLSPRADAERDRSETERARQFQALVRQLPITAERVPQADPADAVATAKMSSGWKKSATSKPPMTLSHPNDHDNRSFSSS